MLTQLLFGLMVAIIHSDAVSAAAVQWGCPAGQVKYTLSTDANVGSSSVSASITQSI